MAMRDFTKYVAILITISAQQEMLGFYSVTIKNESNLTADVTIERAVCGPKNVTLQPGETKTVDTDGYCSTMVRANGRGSKGSFSGLSFTPPGMSRGMSCRDYSLTIKGGAVHTGDFVSSGNHRIESTGFENYRIE
jgi:hypothetical protein